VSHLRRTLGLSDLILFNLAAVIGIRWLAAAAHTGPGALSLWVLAAALFFVPSALAVAALSTRFPEEGGIYVWTKYSFGEWHGFLCGWCYWLSNLFYFPNLLLAGVGMVGQALGFGENQRGIVTASLAILWLVLIANLVGLKVGKWVNNIGGMATYAAGALIVAAGLAVWLRQGSASPFVPLLPRWDWEKVNFWSQIAFAFGGLELGAILGGEIRNPQRTVARAAWISGLAIAAFYIAGTAAMLVLLRPERISVLTGLIQASESAAARLGYASLGWLLTLLVLAGVAGQLGAWISGSARIPFVIGLDRHLPHTFAQLHPRWGTPHWSLLYQGAACTVFLVALQLGENLRTGYQLLVDMTVITYFIPFAYLFAASWKFGRRLSAACGLGVTLMAIAVSLVPPGGAASAWLVELKLCGGCALLIGSARLCFRRGKPAAVRSL